MDTLIAIVCVGIGATIVMDVWGVKRKYLLGLSPPNYTMVGRWIAHMKHGQFYHQSIKNSPVIKGEQTVGWLFHYLTGIIFAAVLIGLWGDQWLQNPTVGPAMLVGLVTVAAPFFIMQPGMGAGIASSKTPNPGSARLHSMINHGVFGLGLYVSGLATKQLIEL
ncbi:DUF2938 domain-containing protein [Endozoicomonas arenosclerae]|uniref:DUF2938 domain-containing protein n=1 Tax=Endozoicomonas arenosclerae TaxID=1633495 RepID=UPI000781808C|nr:DUF2938 domain-containing protein [Endozoicomonas arenosclerae]